jgi:D,D-heptose 1,7-bisphosphate phosphatase
MTAVETFDVAILAGGQGTRLRERAGHRPKPMVSLLGRPLLEYQLELCRRHGFLRVLLLVHYQHDVIREYFGDGSNHGVSLAYQVEETPRGTAGALRDALPRLADRFLTLYGDTYMDVDLRRFWDVHVAHNADVTVFAHPNDHPDDSDIVDVDAAGLVTALHPYPHPQHFENPNLASAALYVMRSNGLESFIPPVGQMDVARDLFPVMLRAGRRLFAHISPEFIKDIGTPERLDQVADDISAGVPERLSGRGLRPAVFLDRDGTLNTQVDYVTRPDHLALLPGIPEAVRRLNRAGHLAVVITNQPVVARGDVTADGLERIHIRLKHLLGLQHAYLDRIYACPHHPDSGYPGEVSELKMICDCRKPATGLVDAACRDLEIHRDASWFIGDTTSDVETGRRAGLKTILVRTGQAGQDGRYPFRPDYVVADMSAAVSWILDGYSVLKRRMAPVAFAALSARLVVIGGLARSGKSSAAQVLKECVAALGRTAHLISLDSWIKPVSERAEGAGVTERYNVEAMVATVARLVGSRERSALELPVYDRANRAQYGRRVHMTIGSDDLLVVEGVPALLVDRLTQLADVRVHLEMAEAERISRLRADYRWRGETDAAVELILASRATDEARPVQEARDRADFLVEAWTDA